MIYFFIGLICAVVNIATFSLLMLFGLSLEISTPASFLVAAALNYVLCIALLFRHKVRWNTSGELVAYLLTIVLMGVLDYGLTIGLVTLLSRPFLASLAIFCCGGSLYFRSPESSGFEWINSPFPLLTLSHQVFAHWARCEEPQVNCGLWGLNVRCPAPSRRSACDRFPPN